MGRLDIDIEAMRIAILRRQQEVMKPFQEELRKLDILETMVEGAPKAIRKHHRNGAGAAYTLPVKGWKTDAKQKRSKANGHAGPYVGMTQLEALREILQKEPQLRATDIAQRMVDGRFPFSTAKPLASVITLLGQMTKKGEVKVTKPESRVGGEANRYRLA